MVHILGRDYLTESSLLVLKAIRQAYQRFSAILS